MRRAIYGLIFGGVVLEASLASAGMPTVNPLQYVETVQRLNPTFQERVQSISFFLLGIVLSAAVVRGLWNYLARDFSTLPRLTFFRSLSLVMIWGLLFVIVLTMISGARELMTPGAWKPNGFTYSLRNDDEPPSGGVEPEHVTSVSANSEEQ